MQERTPFAKEVIEDRKLDSFIQIPLALP